MIEYNKLTKRYYSISEVAALFDLATSVLRYWENEFQHLNPSKGRNGIRRYTKEDIRQVEKIYNLLKERGFTIEGAKKEIKLSRTVNKESSLTTRLKTLKSRLEELRDSLE